MSLKEKIKNSGFKLSYIATQLGLSYTSIKKKMKGEVEFKATEIAVLKQILNLSDSDINLIFFSKNSEYNSLKEKRWEGVEIKREGNLYRRFKVTGTDGDLKELNQLLKEKNITRADLMLILKTLEPIFKNI